MRGKIIIPMYRLWLNGLYGLYGPRCFLFSKRPINLISLSLSPQIVPWHPSILNVLCLMELFWVLGFNHSSQGIFNQIEKCDCLLILFRNFITSKVINGIHLNYTAHFWWQVHLAFNFAACVPLIKQPNGRHKMDASSVIVGAICSTTVVSPYHISALSPWNCLSLVHYGSILMNLPYNFKIKPESARYWLWHSYWDNSYVVVTSNNIARLGFETYHLLRCMSGNDFPINHLILYSYLFKRHKPRLRCSQKRYFVMTWIFFIMQSWN